MKQTAVEWLEERFNNYDNNNGKAGVRKLIKQAKEMEKQQIMHAYGQGVADEIGEVVDATKDAEQYYNQKY